MNVNRFFEIAEIEEPPEKEEERKQKIATLNAEIEKLRAELNQVEPHVLLGFGDDGGAANRLMVEIAGIEQEIFRLKHVVPAYRMGLEQGRAFERWRQGEKKTMKTNKPWNESREWCIERASKLWKAEPERRIGEVSEFLHEELGGLRLWQPKRPDAVKAWLKQAAKGDRLSIPEAATRPGCK